ncbi:Tol-Pal system protein TolB, partial [Mesorhizobium sp. M7A.F.Ca.CA.002.14.1.2]
MKSILKPLLMVAAMAMGMTAAGTLPALALVELNVNKGNVEPLPIAITDFQGGDALGAQISQIVTADLK